MAANVPKMRILRQKERTEKMKGLSLFGESIEPIVEKPTIYNRDYKRNRCCNCGSYPKIHRTRNGKYYVKCHGGCQHWGYERKTSEFVTPQEAVDCWNKNNQKD